MASRYLSRLSGSAETTDDSPTTIFTFTPDVDDVHGVLRCLIEAEQSGAPANVYETELNIFFSKEDGVASVRDSEIVKERSYPGSWIGNGGHVIVAPSGGSILIQVSGKPDSNMSWVLDGLIAYRTRT
jgi:hypothetical protein